MHLSGNSVATLAGDHHDSSLNRPISAERSHGVSWRGLGPARPADFQNTEGTFETYDQEDKEELSDFDADVEQQQRKRNFAVRQSERSKSACKTESVQQS